MSMTRIATIAAAALMLAGCGGGALRSLPAASTTPDEAERAIQSTGTITPTLYVSGQGTVYAYNLSAFGNATPTKVFGSFYNGSDPNPTAIAGIATDRKASLSILQNDGSTEGPSAPSCQVWNYPANATGGLGATPTKTGQCSAGAFFGVGIATAPNGEVDVLDTIENAGLTGFRVERFTPVHGITPAAILNLQSASSYGALAAGALGTIFVSREDNAINDYLDKYRAGAVGNAGFKLENQWTSGRAISAGTACAGTAYVASSNGSTYRVDSFASSTLVAIGTLGPFSFGDNVTALACDFSGNLYVGITTPGTGTRINVYGPQPQATPSIRRSRSTSSITPCARRIPTTTEAPSSREWRSRSSRGHRAG